MATGHAWVRRSFPYLWAMQGKQISWLALGVVIGVAIGALMGNVTAGIGVGLALGIAMGLGSRGKGGG